jgi:hypothetical protein
MSDILSSYADDFSALESDSDLAALSQKLQDALAPIVEWAARKKLMIATERWQVTLFTPFNKEYNHHPDVSIGGVDVPLKYPKILGVTFDVMLCFHKHVANIVAKAWQRLNLLKAVCGSFWGHDKETLLMTFKAFVESVFDLASPVWFPNCKPSNIVKLQLIQNAAMRLVIGCHKGASIDHLYAECKLVLVAEHLFTVTDIKYETLILNYILADLCIDENKKIDDAWKDLEKTQNKLNLSVLVQTV